MTQEFDDKWFKAQQKRAGVTSEDIARKMGRDRSTVSHIYTGRIRMSLEWAKVFSEVLGVPLATILEKAGVAEPSTARQVSQGFSESDAAPFLPQSATKALVSQVQAVAEAFGQRPGVDVWRVKGKSMVGAGLLDGDFILIDGHQSERVTSGDTVIAQVYARNGTAKTVLRRWMPPVLLSVPGGGEMSDVHVVDNENVVIKGKVVACWRLCGPSV